MKENKFKVGDVVSLHHCVLNGNYIVIAHTADNYVLVHDFEGNRVRVESKELVNKIGILISTVEDKSEELATTLSTVGISSEELSQSSKEDDNIEEDDYDEKLVHEHQELTMYLNSLYKIKNKKYGDSFGQSVREFGCISALTRMSDKYNRLKQLIMSNQTGSDTDESLEDTLVDLANYCLMTVMEINHAKNVSKQ